MSTATDVLREVIEKAVEAGVRKALNVNETTNRRLLSVDEAARYLSLSKREVYNMVAHGELPAVRHGRRTMLDIRDLDHWIERSKGA
jgi:excisionase family DNA binding protein